jgi:hypothetical protein
MVNELEVARLRIAAVSIISTMKVDWFFERSSDAPTIHKNQLKNH